MSYLEKMLMFIQITVMLMRKQDDQSVGGTGPTVSWR